MFTDTALLWRSLSPWSIPACTKCYPGRSYDTQPGETWTKIFVGTAKKCMHEATFQGGP